MYFDMSDDAYLFKRIYNPKKACTDKIFRGDQILNFLQMMKLLSNQSACIKLLLEALLSKSRKGNENILIEGTCGNCKNCKQANTLVQLFKEGMQMVRFNIFVSGRNKVQGTMTLKVLQK